MRSRLVHTLAAALVTFTAATAVTAAPAQAAVARVNDWSCVPSAAHPEPVVVLHGLGATYYEDLNFLQSNLAGKGYCTFSLTYGNPDGFPYVGGLKPIAESAQQIKAFIQRVVATTGAPKVDLVGHSEGAFQALYVTKTQGIAAQIAKVLAIAPPTHGTNFAGLYNLAYLFGIRGQVDSALKQFGCAACTDLGPGGDAVNVLTNGPIAQPGVSYTILTSRVDELVTPTETSFVREPGVKNAYIQDTCPLDPVGHLGEAYDLNVWHLVANALDPAHAARFICTFGSPG
jgi:pimeloyl-ACP methyl ester carboxylesterase